jgi:CRISPR-associated protein Csx10
MLKPGQRFRSELWVRTTIVGLSELAKETSNVSASIGRAKATGYGQVTITIKPRKSEAVRSIETEAKDGVVSLYFASDTVLRLGQPLLETDKVAFTPLEALLAALGESYGIKATIEEVEKSGVRSKKAELRLRRGEGWISSWGLPRPTRMAIAAGSTAKVRVARPDGKLAQALQSLAENGLGEFRGRGVRSRHCR